MHDIRLAAALVMFVSVGCFLLSLRLFDGRTNRFLDFVAVVLVILTGAYGYLVFGQLWIVRWIPLPSVAVLSNWFPPLAAILSAVAWLRLRPASVARRLPVVLLLWGAAAYSVLHLVPTEPPVCENQWAPARPPVPCPVCLQTTPYTCSAASAATLLNCIGFPTTEQEMAELCLTRSGTTWLGMYHGLTVKLLREPYRVEFFETNSQDLPSLVKDSPALLCCMLDKDLAKMAPDYVSEGGWIPGVAHTVVYFGKLGEKHIIGDPSRGFEAWSPRDLNTLWTGQGLKIVAQPGLEQAPHE